MPESGFDLLRSVAEGDDIDLLCILKHTSRWLLGRSVSAYLKLSVAVRRKRSLTINASVLLATGE